MKTLIRNGALVSLAALAAGCGDPRLDYVGGYTTSSTVTFTFNGKSETATGEGMLSMGLDASAADTVVVDGGSCTFKAKVTQGGAALAFQPRVCPPTTSDSCTTTNEVTSGTGQRINANVVNLNLNVTSRVTCDDGTSETGTISIVTTATKVVK